MWLKTSIVFFYRIRTQFVTKLPQPQISQPQISYNFCSFKSTNTESEVTPIPTVTKQTENWLVTMTFYVEFFPNIFSFSFVFLMPAISVKAFSRKILDGYFKKIKF